MREVTRDLIPKLKAEIDNFFREGDFTCRLGKHVEIKIPRWVVDTIEQRVRIYEVENIEDIQQNYSDLAAPSHMPLGFWVWVIYGAVPPMFKEVIQEVGETDWKDTTTKRDEMREKSVEWEEFRFYACPAPFPKDNLNFAAICNVYLNEFRFIKRKLFEACEFKVSDRWNNPPIEGIFVYRQQDNPGLIEDLAMTQLTLMLKSDGRTPFDLQFATMKEHWKMKKDGVVYTRGRKILVYDIQHHEGQNEDAPYPLERNTFPIPIPIPIQRLVRI